MITAYWRSESSAAACPESRPNTKSAGNMTALSATGKSAKRKAQDHRPEGAPKNLINQGSTAAHSKAKVSERRQSAMGQSRTHGRKITNGTNGGPFRSFGTNLTNFRYWPDPDIARTMRLPLDQSPMSISQKTSAQSDDLNLPSACTYSQPLNRLSCKSQARPSDNPPRRVDALPVRRLPVEFDG